jgi:argininosuccinate lyase
MTADTPPEIDVVPGFGHNRPQAQWASLQWGGRFSEGPAAIMQAINASIGFDHRLWREDIQGSLAHAAMLAHQGIISQSDEAAIRAGLSEIGDTIADGKFVFDPALEDIHTNVEARLVERVGEAGRRLQRPGRNRL